MASRSTLTLGLAIAGVLAALLATGYWAMDASPPQPSEKHAEARTESPQLHCVMIGYTGAPRLAFLFDIGQDGSEVRFEQLYLVEMRGADKTKREPPFEDWRLDTSTEPARLESEIRVFDNTAAGSHSEKITIELYNYRPERTDGGFIEAGLKNIHYQNLSGHCQQSRPVSLAQTSN